MDLDKFFQEETVKDKSKQQEKKVAKKVKGRTTIGSGCLHFDKGDVSVDKVRIECKRTDKASLILKKDWLVKIIDQCRLGEIPALNLEIQDQNWFLIRSEEFQYILERIKEE